MRPPSITLVLSNHIPAIESALVRMGRPVVVCTTAAHARLRGPDTPYPVHTVTDWTAYEQLDALADSLRGRIGSVATRFEGAVVAAAYLRGRLRLPGQNVHDAIGFVDKSVMKARLHEAGVPVAKHRVVAAIGDIETAARGLGWPVVVKPRTGFASTNVHRIDSAAELRHYIADGTFDTPLPASDFYRDEPAFRGLACQPDGILVEQHVNITHEFHVDGLWWDGQPVYQIPGLYHTPPLQGMGGMLGSVLLDPDHGTGAHAVELATRAGRALRMGTGFTHAEILRTADDQWLVGEIAARPGGGGIQAAIAHAYHLDLSTLQALVAYGQRPTVALNRRPGYIGWCGPAVPPGRITHIADRDQLLNHPGVLDASVAVTIGQEGGRTGSGLWGGLAGHTILHADDPNTVLRMMPEAADRYQITVTRPGAMVGS